MVYSGQQGDSVGKFTELILRTQVKIGENQFHKVVLWPPHMDRGMSHIYAIINVNSFSIVY